LSGGISYAQIVINEGCNKNYTVLADEDGEYGDWIELYNAGASAVDLTGYYLTDDAADPDKWEFSNLVIPAGGYEIVFCSSKNKYQTPPFTNVLTATGYTPIMGWNTHTLTTPFNWDGTSNIVINTCSWSSLGYTVNSQFNQDYTPFNSSLFAVNDGSEASCSAVNGNLTSMRPIMQFNGIQVGTAVVQNSPYDYPAPYGNWYFCARHQFMYSAAELTAAGLTAGNISDLAWEVVWPDGIAYDYVDISMIHVPESEMTSAFYPLTGFKNHTNFSIDGEGETVYLFSPALSMVSSLEVNTGTYDDSKGCFTDATSVYKLFDTPTPAATNDGSTTYDGYLDAPIFSQLTAIYSLPLSAAIYNTNGPDSYIRYTLDGSEPMPFSANYTGPIPVSSTTVLRARIFDSDSLPSPVTTATYFYGIDHQTPIISVTSDNSNMFGTTGMFSNWWADWLKPAHVEYLDSMPWHPVVFSQDAGIMVDGGAGGSRSNPQTSFRIEWANGTFGGDGMHHEVIPDRAGRMEYNTFYMRNGSNQYLSFPQKDAMQVKMMCKDLNAYYSAWRPASVYLNGEYYGLYELREKYDRQKFVEEDGATPNTVEIVGLSYWYGLVLHAMEGNVDNFWASYDNFLLNDPASSDFWDATDTIFDLEYYTDYIISESWMGNVDWPTNNIKIYRSDSTGYAWRFCTIDLELGMAPNNWSDCYTDMIGYMMGQSTSIPYINIWLQGIQNNQFRDYFINRYADVMNTAYLPDRLMDIEQGIFDQAYPEMPNEYFRWGNPFDIPGQMADYVNNYYLFQGELNCRSDQVRDDIEWNFSLPQQVDVELDVIPSGAGHINISTISPETYPWNGIYFDGVPIKVEAVNHPGWLFAYWESDPLIADVLDNEFYDTLSASSAQFRAHFTADLSAVNGTDKSGFFLYPSPADEEIFLEIPDGFDVSGKRFEIVDLNGRSLAVGILDNSEDKIRIPIGTLEDGMYFFRLADDAETVNLRFLKQ